MNIALIAQGSLINKKEATWLTLHGLAKKYNEQGHLAVICANGNPNLPKVEVIDGVKVYRLTNNKGITRIFNARKSLKAISEKEKITFDIIHGFSSSPLMALNTYFTPKKSKKIHTIKSYSRFFWGKKFTKVLNLVDAVSVPTSITKEFLLQNGTKKRVEIIRSSINLDKFKPGNKDKLKEKYGFSDKKLIFYYGAMNIHKGVDYLLKAVQKLEGVNVILAQRSACKEATSKYSSLINNLGIKDKAKIITSDIKIEDYVAMADVVVLAYPDLVRTEGNPSCLLESMACKTLVVTTNLPEIKEIAEECCLFAQPGDVDSLVIQIKKALYGDNLEIIENGFKKAQEFDINTISKQFLELYEEL